MTKADKYRIWLSTPDLAGGEADLLKEAIAGNWIAPAGPYSLEFENQVAEYAGSKYALAVNSGTSAIHLALMSIGIGPGDEVICPTFTFAASVFPVLYQQATPVLVDSESTSWNISPELVETTIADRIKKGKKVKAILAVDIYGQPADMREIVELGERFGIPVIEDAAQALGSRTGSKMAGSFGKAGIFSFNGNKIITTSAGGMLVSDDAGFISKAKYYAGQAKTGGPFFQHEAVGYNYKMSDLLAAIGCLQIGVIDRRIASKRNIYKRYREALEQFSVISFQPELTDTFSNRWLTSILLDEKHKIRKEDIHQALLEKGIEARYLMKPMHLQPALKDVPFYGNGVSEDLFRRGISLPSGTALTEKEQAEVIEVVRNLFGT